VIEHQTRLDARGHKTNRAALDVAGQTWWRHRATKIASKDGDMHWYLGVTDSFVRDRRFFKRALLSISGDG